MAKKNRPPTLKGLLLKGKQKYSDSADDVYDVIAERDKLLNHSAVTKNTDTEINQNRIEPKKIPRFGPKRPWQLCLNEELQHEAVSELRGTSNPSIESLDSPNKMVDSATHGQEEDVRSELKSELTKLNLKMDTDFKKIDSRFKGIEANIQEVLTAVHSIKVAVEDQNSKNLNVLQDLMARLQKLEKSTYGVEN